MKRVFNIWKWALMLSMAVTVASCGKDNTVHQLPDCKEIICNAGDHPTLTFTSGGDWQLSSDQVWCKFITSAGDLQEMAGPAGIHTVSLNITDENIKDSPTFANIIIRIGSQSAVLATVERGANKLYLKIYDITDTPTTSIEVGYVDWVPFKITANFRFAATDYPEWVEFGVKGEGNTMTPTTSITGTPGDTIEAYARIVNNGERECYKITEEDGYKITFSSERGESFEIPVIYKGMGTDQIAFEGPTESIFGWEVSRDGTLFRQHSEETNQTVTYNSELQFNIIALNREYHVLHIEKIIERGIPSYTIFDYTGGDRTWMCLDTKEDTFTVNAMAEGDDKRYGTVMVLPTLIYNKIRASLEDNIFEMDSASGIELPTIANNYQQYVILEFTQYDFEAEATEGMYIYHSLTTLDIPAQAHTNASLAAEYGVEDIWKCPFVNSVAGKKPGIVIDPHVEGWNTEAFEAGNATAEVYHNGEKLKISEGEYYLGENMNEEMALHLWGPNEGWNGGDVHIIFKVGDEAKKLLVVTPPAK